MNSDASTHSDPHRERPVALVTGASRGIGRAGARALAKAGFHVVAAARAQKALESLDDEIRAEGGSMTIVPLDLKDAEALDRLGGALYERFGRLDALLAAAGILGGLAPVSHSGHRQIEDVLGVNLLANIRLIRAMDPLLRLAKSGRALFLTSGAAHRAIPFWGLYAASKAGLERLVMTWAEEVSVAGIGVNLFDPGAVRTAMRAQAFPGEDAHDLPAPEEIAAFFPAILSPGETRTGLLLRYDRAEARLVEMAV